MPTPPAHNPQTDLPPDAADALATMEADASAFFAERDAGRNASALNPVAPALERAVASPTPAKVAAKAPVAPVTPAKPAVPTPTAGEKVRGAPVLTPLATKKESVATAEPAPAPDISDLPTTYVPGTVRAPHWERLRANRDHFEALAAAAAAERDAVRAELEQTRTGTANGALSADAQARLTSLQAERDNLQVRLEAVAVEQSPRFEAQFKPRCEAALSQAKAAVGPAEAQRIDALLALPESSYRDEQVEALLTTLPPLRATKLTQAVADLDRLAAERTALAAQGSTLYRQWTSEETAARERAANERNAAATQTFESELRGWSVAGVTPDEAEAARAVYTGKGATLHDASRAALWGAVGPRVAQALSEAGARVIELESELARLRGAQPGVGAGGAGALPSTNDDDDPLDTTSYADRIAKQVLRAGVRFGS